eukprot:51930_1
MSDEETEHLSKFQTLKKTDEPNKAVKDKAEVMKRRLEMIRNQRMERIRQQKQQLIELENELMAKEKSAESKQEEIKVNNIHNIQYIKPVVIFPINEWLHEENIKFKKIPLHRFNVDDICNTIHKWVTNDIIHKAELKKTHELFLKHKLSGDSLLTLSSNELKVILPQCITPESFNIISESIDQWKTDLPESVRSKTPQQIASILHNIPLNQLISAIKYSGIDGNKIIDILLDNKNNFIKINTGWRDEEEQ